MLLDEKMTEYRQIDVLIVGSGPAGMSTALHLVKANPAWAERVVVVDKAVHPREKLCGGGVTQLGEAVLTRLGLPFEPAHVPVREVRLAFGQTAFSLRDDPVFRVVRRAEFDHWLVRCGERQGLTVRQGEAVLNISPHPDYVEVETDVATFRARVVVAADGSRSTVRRKLRWDNEARLARLLEVLTPEVAERQVEFREGVAVFDFSPMIDSLQGYYWDFPSLINGQPFMNRGVFDSRARPERPRAALKEILRQAMAGRERRLEDYPLKGHPLHWFDPQGRFAQARVLMVGDAAGVDPLLGEGISFALAYGEVAAAAINEAFARQNFSFADYRTRILAHRTLSHLRMRAGLAQLFHRFDYPWMVKLVWRITPLIIRGLPWYRRDYVPVREPRLVKVST
jgi:geranylgeranyl reductase family protein